MIEAHPKTSPAIEKYQLTALDMQSEILDFWNFTRWQKLRNRLKRRHWIWDHKGLRMRPALEAAAAADRLAKALEAHDPEIEPLYDRIRIYDDTPPENYGQSPDDFQTQRDNFVWMFREIKRTCEALAGRGADMVTFVRINE